MLVILLILITGLMFYQATQVKMTYDNPKFIPDSDVDYQAYQLFKKTFGDDGRVLVIGIETDKINKIEFFRDWYALSDELENRDGIEKLLSICNVPGLSRKYEQTILDGDTFQREVFSQKRIIESVPKTQEELDDILSQIRALKFYEGLLFQDSGNFTLIAATLNKKLLDTKERITFVKKLKSDVSEVCKKHGVEAHFSGLPYIRTEFSNRIRSEIVFFTVLSIFITAIILLIFFKSFVTMLFSLLVVLVGVAWSMGILHLLGYKITMFIGLLPPLIVVIGIANCIYLLNKYHDEYRSHRNQIRSLQRVIAKVGLAVFFTNLTTAIGFGVFILTGSTVLKEFGLTAFLSVMSVYIISIVLIPVIFSFLPPPTSKHTRHLDTKWLNKAIVGLSFIISGRRKLIYAITLIIVVLAFVGMLKIKAVGYMVDDISKSEQLYKDLKFFETNIGGVLPFEIVIDTKKENGVYDPTLLQKIDYFERDKLEKLDELSRSVSIAQIVKFARQSLHENNPIFYRTPNALELNNIMNLLPSGDSNNSSQMIRSLLDSSKQKARISVQAADIGSVRIKELRESVSLMADSIFNYNKIEETIFTDSIIAITTDTSYDEETEEFVIGLDTEYATYTEVTYEPVDSSNKVDVFLTGTSIIFLKGNDYLIKNLFLSLAVAFLIIGLIMASIFISLRMIMISLVPNIIPLLITAGFMGYFNVSLKPSTVLVFSVAFGIAVDFTIHFLSKYRMELKRNGFKIQKAVLSALNETGVSMIYTAVILFFGFIIFSGSSFGGTIALGVFTSITLIVSVLSNLILLPALLLSYDLAKERQKSRKQPLVHYPDADV